MTEPQHPVVIRRFDSARDAPSLRQCVIDQQDFHRTLEPSWPAGEAIIEEYMAYLQRECAAGNGCILLADAGETAVGFVCVVADKRGDAPDDPAPFAWIQELYVSPEHRGRGVAAMLLAEAEGFARGEGARRLRLGVLDSNARARSFYAKHGFREHVHILTKGLD
jgi:GNAT superfamily N-acetyltransferase